MKAPNSTDAGGGAGVPSNRPDRPPSARQEMKEEEEKQQKVATGKSGGGVQKEVTK